MFNVNNNLAKTYRIWTSFSKKPTKKHRTKRKTSKLKRIEHFHRYKHQIPSIILGAVDDKEIIYGARALNKRFPNWLDRHTEDFDIYSTHPKKDAKQAEQKLDRAFGGDYFFVKQAMHPGTWKVKAHANQQTYADYTKPEQHIPYDRIGNKKYVKLSFVKKHIRKTLKDPSAQFRWDKDKDALNRILIYEKMRQR